MRKKWEWASPDVDMSVVEIVGGVKHAQALLDLLLEPVFEAASVSSSEFDLLLHLHRVGGPATARRLATSMSRSPAALSKSLTKLERRGLVEREAHPADGRAMLVSLTDAGKGALDEIMPRRLAVEGQAFSGLNAGQRTRIVASLDTLISALETPAPAE